MPGVSDGQKGAVDIIVDLRQDPAGRAALLLESLLTADEGHSCRYHVRLSRRRLSPEVHAQLFDLIADKQARIYYDLPDIEFPQELVDSELAESTAEDDRRRAVAKQAWFALNLSILDAIETYDEFVYLLPSSIPVSHEWLAVLVEAGRKWSEPVLGYPRKLLINSAYHTCGWSMMGWYDGKRLRQLPLRAAFAKRLENPWEDLGDFRQQRHGPGFCLAGKWLSGFDVPIDFLLFALYYRTTLGSDDPLEWSRVSEACIQTVVTTDSYDDEAPGRYIAPTADAVLVEEKNASRPLQKEVIRKLYRVSASRGLESVGSVITDDILALPHSGPEWNMLGNNRIRFDMRALKDLFKGERCFLIGNGPSLLNTDFSLLHNEYTIGLNRIYLNYSNMGFQPSFLCITNPNITTQFHHEIDALDSIKFLTYKAMQLMRNRWNTFFMESRGVHDFYQDLEQQIWCEGCTVTYCALQVAFYLGFETVILVGVDHSFSDPGIPHKLVTATGPDQNHFHPDYFGKGVKWQYPDLPSSEVSYRVAKSVFEQHGRRILDATVNGKLQVFPKVNYAEFLSVRS